MRSTLKNFRINYNLTYQEIADNIGVSKPYYWQIENGKRGLSYELAVKIAAVFKTNPDSIFLNDELTTSEQNEGDDRNVITTTLNRSQTTPY